MDFSELVRKRQSDRRYEERAVPRELVMRCIEAARLAPISYMIFYVVNNITYSYNFFCIAIWNFHIKFLF